VGEGRREPLRWEWHRSAKSKTSVKSKGLGRIGEGEQFPHSGAYTDRIAPPHLTTPYTYSPNKPSTPRALIPQSSILPEK